MTQETIKPRRTHRAFLVSSDSGRAPGREHLVWHRYFAPDGSSRSRVAAESADRTHAQKIADHLNSPGQAPNWPAVIAAVSARGPRCEFCGSWTFRPQLLSLPGLIRACPDCMPSPVFRSLAGH